MPRLPSPDPGAPARPLIHAPQGSPGAFSSLQIAPSLIAWQKRAGRHDLPWQVRDPYRVWLSEIMLQQTQVATVIPYYQAFLARFPDVQALAAAPLEQVMALWSGLGYYSRARNLHRCAQAVVSDHGGRFPEQPEALAQLPGIGPSTAAAIAVFSFGARAAILDGNVKRVLARVFALAADQSLPAHERELWTIARQQLPEQDIRAYTQGLMDLGASLCSLRRPRCGDCPLQGQCQAARCGLQASLPSARKRKAVPTRQACFVLATRDAQVLLELQPAPGLWGGLWSLPMSEPIGPPAEPAAAKAASRAIGAPSGLPDAVSHSGQFSHAFTHFRLQARVLHLHPGAAPAVLQVSEPGGAGGDGPERRWMPITALAGAALPRPIKTYLLETFRERLAASGNAAAPAGGPADRPASSGAV